MFLHILPVVVLAGSVFSIPGSDPWAQATLKAHNTYRAKHGSPPLKYDDSIAKYAQNWAEDLTSRDAFEHRSEYKYGENLFKGSSPKYTGKDATDAWYKEVKDYKNYDLDVLSPDSKVRISKVGHFTQVVWKASKFLGCGFSSGSSGTVIVCNYDPPGNVRNQFTKNVRPPTH